MDKLTESKQELDPKVVRLAHNFLWLYHEYQDDPRICQVYEVQLAESIAGQDGAYHGFPSMGQIDAGMKMAREANRRGTPLPDFAEQEQTTTT